MTASTHRMGRPVVAYLLATGLSLLGNALVTVVLPWIVLERHGAATAAMVAAAAGLPTAVGALLAAGWSTDGVAAASVSAPISSPA